MNNLLLRAIALVFVFYSVSWGDDSTLVDTSAGYDTTLYIPKGVEGTVYGAIDSIDYETKLTQNPTVALFKSMLVPGLGQIGNRKYVKAALIIGLDAWLISSAVNHGRDASNLHNQFSAATDISERNKLYDNYLDSKDQRNKYTWFAVIVTF
ncbi:MAG: DUF5683 domain-containing protein, partial [Candidatus Zixiibacteriota bacterium]